MIDESVLERLLHDEAAAYDVPADGPARVLEEAAEDEDRRPRPGRSLTAAAVAVLVAAGIAIGGGIDRFGGVSDEPQAGYSTTMLADEGSRKPVTDADAQTTGGSVGGAGAGAGNLLVEGANVARTGETWLEVPEARVDDAVNDVARIARAHGGYVAESRAQSGEGASGFVSIRVPVDRFDQAAAEVARLGDVRHASTTGEDVTAKVTDTNARLKSAIATRAQLRTLLTRATDVGDVLAVQERITEVQTEIEKLTATQKSLADRTAFAGLGVTVSPPGGPEERGGFSKAWHDAVDGFVGGFEALVAASGTIAFALLIGGVLFLVARRAYRFWVRGVV